MTKVYNVDERVMNRISDAIKKNSLLPNSCSFSTRINNMAYEELNKRYYNLIDIGNKIISKKASDVVMCCDKINKTYIDSCDIVFGNKHLDGAFKEQFEITNMEQKKVMLQMQNIYKKYYDEVIPCINALVSLIESPIMQTRINNTKYYIFYEILFLIHRLDISFITFNELANALQEPSVEENIKSLKHKFNAVGNKLFDEYNHKTNFKLKDIVSNNYKNSLAFKEFIRNNNCHSIEN